MITVQNGNILRVIKVARDVSAWEGQKNLVKMKIASAFIIRGTTNEQMCKMPLQSTGVF